MNKLPFLLKAVDLYIPIFILFALINFITYKVLNPLLLVLTVFGFTKCVLSKYKWSGIDLLIIIWILYQLGSVVFSSYPFELYYRGVLSQVIPCLFFFIGRSHYFATNSFYENTYYPLLISMVCGVALLILAPDWYVARKVDDAVLTNVDELMRLSSFFSSSYFMGYASVLFGIYFAQALFEGKSSLKNILFFVISIIVCLLTQHRVAIAFYLLYLLGLSFFFYKKHRSLIVKVWIFFSLIGVALFFIIPMFIDERTLEFMLNKGEDSSDIWNLITERIGSSIISVNGIILGQGLGRFGHQATELNLPAITDCDYFRVIAELGIFGLFIFILILLKSIARYFKYKEHLRFELCVVLFYAASMIGAAPLEVQNQMPFMLWFTIGHMFNNNYIQNKNYI